MITPLFRPRGTALVPFLVFLYLGFVAPAGVWAQPAADDIPLPTDPPVPGQTIRAATPAPPAGAVTGAEDLPIEDPAPAAAQSSTAAHTAQDSVDVNPAPAQDSALVQDFMKHALFAGVCVALLCSYLGLFVVTRRMVFIGVSLAELSSAGIAFGLFLQFTPLWGALLFMVLGVALFSRRWAPKRLPNDGVIGVFYLVAIASGILLVSKSPHGEMHMLKLLQGDILAVYPHETWQMAWVFLAIGAIHVLCHKEFLLVSLDRDTAATQGFAAGRWDFFLVLTIGLAVSMAIRSVGVLLTSAMLIIPAATALLIMPRWNRAAILAPLLGIVAVCLGLQLSLKWDFSASAVIVAVSFALFFPALVWRSLKFG